MDDGFAWSLNVYVSGTDDVAWPAAVRTQHLFWNSYETQQPGYGPTDTGASYAWLCLESLPPVEGLEDAPADWKGVAFFHGETVEEGVVDYLLPFDHADCVTAENTWEPNPLGEHECTSDADGLDNDYDGVVDEGGDYDGDGRSDCPSDDN